MWRRSEAKVLAPERLAEADPFRDSLRLARRDAFWALKGLRDEPLPLLAAAARHNERPPPEINEEVVQLKAMTAGLEVVEDHQQAGLSLRDHPVTFFRADLAIRNIVTYEAATNQRAANFIKLAGLVLSPAEARLSRRRDVHHARGRDRRRQFRHLAELVREAAPADPDCQDDWGSRAPCSGKERWSTSSSGGCLTSRASLPISGSAPRRFRCRIGAEKFHHGSVGGDMRTLPPPKIRTRDIYVSDLHIDNLKMKHGIFVDSRSVTTRRHAATA